MTVTAGGTRIIFYGFGAYVGALRGPTQCEWWPDDPASLNWSTSCLIPTDLAKNLSAARNGLISIADIQCDDHRSGGGLTSIGPRFPQGSMVGALWLSAPYWSSLGSNQPRRPALTDAHDYELTSIVYWDGPLKGRRFFGFHARILGAPQGNLARVEVYHGGRSKVPNERPAGPFWIDLAQDAHPVEPGATEIGPGQVEGALFLEDRVARTFILSGPKQPPTMGLDLY